MADRGADRKQAEFVRQMQAANNQITEKLASELYFNRDAVHALLAIPMGQRIIIDKSKNDTN